MALQDHEKPYSCPECRKEFTPRPSLVRNNMLAVVVEELKKTLGKDASSDLCYAGPKDVSCDLCTEKKEKAFKFCLQCLVSYCKTHLQPHYDVDAFKIHKLVDATERHRDSVCSQHQEVMKLFCRTDQQCICYLCSKDNHKGHTKVSAAAERNARQSELELTRQKIQQRIQIKEKDVKLLEQEEDAIIHSADKALRNAEKVFSELMRIFQRRVSDMKDKIKSRQDAELGLCKKVRKKAEQELAELRWKDAELNKLSRAEDHTYFLLNYLPLSHLSMSKDPPSSKVRHLRHFEKVTVALSEAGDKLQEVLFEEYSKITMVLPEEDTSLSKSQAEPQTRADFLRYACQITLNPNTANTHLSLSKENREATFRREEQKYSLHPERFAYSWQVLSRECLTGQCYWEVERSGRGVLVALAYKDISRSGDFNQCVFGNNKNSWALDCFKNSYEFRHNNRRTPIPGTWSSRIGVYLDFSAGILSFYSISETMSLLQRVETTFTKPLYAGVWLSDGATAEFCKLR